MTTATTTRAAAGRAYQNLIESRRLLALHEGREQTKATDDRRARVARHEAAYRAAKAAYVASR
jgi:hypothetical protein